MSKQLKRLSEFAPQETVMPELHKLSEVLNREMILTELEFRNGDFGEYAVFKLQDPDTGETATYSCGGSAIMKQLTIVGVGGLPLAVMPIRVGRSFVFA